MSHDSEGQSFSYGGEGSGPRPSIETPCGKQIDPNTRSPLTDKPALQSGRLRGHVYYTRGGAKEEGDTSVSLSEEGAKMSEDYGRFWL